MINSIPPFMIFFELIEWLRYLAINPTSRSHPLGSPTRSHVWVGMKHHLGRSKPNRTAAPDAVFAYSSTTPTPPPPCPRPRQDHRGPSRNAPDQERPDQERVANLHVVRALSATGLRSTKPLSPNSPQLEIPKPARITELHGAA